MNLDLSPKLPKKVYGGDGGSYLAWDPSELPMLKAGNIGAGKLALEKDGFALPRYSDSAKVAYILQGIDRFIPLALSHPHLFHRNSVRIFALLKTSSGTHLYMPIPCRFVFIRITFLHDRLSCAYDLV